MFKNNEKINSSQMANIIILTLIGTGILTLPQSLADAAGTDGWIVLIVGGIVTTGVVYLHGYIVKKLPGKGLLEIITLTLTKPVAYIVISLFIIYFLVLNAFLVRIFGEVVKMFLLERTPIEVIIFSVLLTTVYLVRKGIEPLGRLAEFLLPILLIISIPLFLLTIQRTDFSNLRPLFTINWRQLINAMPVVFFSFLGFEVILVFGLFLNKPQKATKAVVSGTIFVLVFYLLLNTLVLAEFGVNQTKHLIWPTLSLFKTIEFPGVFIENVEAMVMALWVFIVFMSIAPLYLSKILLIRDFVGGKDYKYFALPLVTILYIIALFPENVAETYHYLDMFVNYGATTMVIIVPALVFIGLSIRRYRRKNNG